MTSPSVPSDETWLNFHDHRIAAASTRGLVLELGCGDGRDTSQLTRAGYSVVACDISAHALACEDRLPGVRKVRLDLGHPLPFAGGRFSVVLASLCLHYFPWDVTLLAINEIRRCLRPGGLVLSRLNSTKDVNYGAASTRVISDHYYEVGPKRKRFFDEAAVVEAFSQWRIAYLEEKLIDRYDKSKAVWELVAYAS